MTTDKDTDNKNAPQSWTAAPEKEDDAEVLPDAEIEQEAADAALATAELFQNLDFNEPPRDPDPRYEADAIPAQDDELADDEPENPSRRVGGGMSRGLFWAIGLAFGLMIAAAVGVVWMIFNMIARFA